MAEEQGLSGENRRLVERFYQERAPEAMSALGTAPFNRLNALLDAARSEGPLPVGGEGREDLGSVGSGLTPLVPSRVSDAGSATPSEDC